MDIILDITGKVLIVFVTGLVTFLITRYTQHDNRPLDKIEIAYNRVYYPLFLITINTEYKTIDHNKFQEEVKFILKKYRKFVSRSTIMTYNVYLDAYSKNSKINTKNAYEKFANNIRMYNSKLRNKLGYPDANIYELIRSLPSYSKVIYAAGFSYILFFFGLSVYSIIQNQIVLVFTSFFLLFTIVCIIVYVIMRATVYVIDHLKFRRSK